MKKNIVELNQFEMNAVGGGNVNAMDIKKNVLGYVETGATKIWNGVVNMTHAQWVGAASGLAIGVVGCLIPICKCCHAHCVCFYKFSFLVASIGTGLASGTIYDGVKAVEKN